MRPTRKSARRMQAIVRAEMRAWKTRDLASEIQARADWRRLFDRSLQRVLSMPCDSYSRYLQASEVR